MNKCPRHPNKTLHNICIKDDCKADRLCCIACVKQHHQNHDEGEIVDIEEFMIIVDKSRLQRTERHKENEKLLKNLERQFEDMMQKLYRVLDRLKKIVQNMLSQIKTKFEGRNQLQTLILKHEHILNVPIEQLSQAVTGQVHKIIHGQKDNRKLVWSGLRPLIDNELRKISEPNFVEFAKSAIKYAGLKQKIEKQCRWSQDLKHEYISITAETAHKKMPSYCNAILADVVLDPASTQYEWTITVHKNQNNCFYLGACLQSIVKLTNFRSVQSRKQLGHGYYIFGSDKLIRNSIDSASNGTFSNYSVNQDLPITVHVDFQSRRISLNQNGHVLKEMPIEVPKEPMRPVLLLGLNSLGYFSISNMTCWH